MHNKSNLTNIISSICVIVSLLLLSTGMLDNYTYSIESFREPVYTGSMPSSISLQCGDAGTQESDNRLKLFCKSACLMDAATGRVLYSDNDTSPLPMASTTKIMTCILALESGKLNDTVTVSKYAAGMPDVQLNMKEGEQYILADLLYSLMLESHNDTAVAIAEHIGGTVEGFAAMMNEKAASLGCLDTYFVTPNGLDKGEHHSTARDLCIIASYAVKNTDFINIVNTMTYSFSDISKTRTYTVSNHDAFLQMYEGAIGIKTGFTGKAGYCFVGAANRDNTTLVSAVLASGWPPNKSYKWSDTKALMDYGYNNYRQTTLLSGDITLPNLPVLESNGYCNSTVKELPLTLYAYYSMLTCSSDKAVLTIELPPYISAPILKDEVIGTACLIVNDEIIEEYPITASIDIPTLEYMDYFSIIIDTLARKM